MSLDVIATALDEAHEQLTDIIHQRSELDRGFKEKIEQIAQLETEFDARIQKIRTGKTSLWGTPWYERTDKNA